MVGVSAVCCGGDFALPEHPDGIAALNDFLGPRVADDTPLREPPASQAGARANLGREIARLRAEGIDPGCPDRVADVDSSPQWASKSGLIAPCLTHSRAQGLWLVARGRLTS